MPPATTTATQYELPLPPPTSVLLVTADTPLALDLRKLLHGAGFAVRGVTQSARGALAHIARHKPQLVLIDLIDSTALDGVELAARLRAHREIAIVFLAEDARTAVLERALTTAPDGYVVKPCSAQSLIAAAHLAILRRSQQCQLEAANARLEREAVLDPLTGLYNRRAFAAAVARETQLAHRKDTWLSCLIIDLDHFKTINDTYGHAVGDQVLSRFAQCLGARLRSYDVACRYGGDEFVVILPGCAPTGAVRLANEIVGRARTLATRHDLPIAVTVSIGVASARGSTIDAERLLAMADENLLQAKRQGRDRAHGASRPSPSKIGRTRSVSPPTEPALTVIAAGAAQLPCAATTEAASGS